MTQCRLIKVKFFMVPSCLSFRSTRDRLGRTTSAHRRRLFTSKEREAFLDDVWLTLDKFKVPAEERSVSSSRDDGSSRVQ